MTKEVPGDGDVLLGCPCGAPLQLAGGGELAHPAQVVPSGELLEEGAVIGSVISARTWLSQVSKSTRFRSIGANNRAR